MQVILYGATGNSGSRILKELISRGHDVTAIARDTAKVPAGVKSKQDDLSSVDAIAAIAADADVVVSAYAPPQDNPDALLGVTERQIAAAQKVGSVRLIVVGGAGSLEVAPDVSLLASGHLPEAYVPIATAHGKVRKLLEASSINWTYFCPAAYFEPGERTGKFRLGTKELVANDKGESRISMEDYAIALVDEIESQKRTRATFSIGY